MERERERSQLETYRHRVWSFVVVEVVKKSIPSFESLPAGSNDHVNTLAKNSTP